MHALKILWGMVSSEHRKYAVLLVCFLLIGAFFESIGLGLILPLIGLMTAPDTIMRNQVIAPLLDDLGNPDHITLFFMCLGLMNALFLLSTCYRVWLAWYQTTYLNKLKVDTSTRLYNIYLHQPWPFYTSRHSSTLIQNVGKEVELITQYGYAGALNLTRECIFILVIGVMLINMAPLPAILAVVSLAPLAWGFQKLSRLRIRLWADKRQQIEAARLKTLQEGLSLIKEIRLSSKEDVFTSEFDKLSKKVSDIERYQSFMRQLSRPTFEFYAILTVSLIIILMWNTGLSLTDIAPVLGLFSLALLRFIPSISQILVSVHGIRYITPILGHIAEDLKKQPSLQNQNVTARLPFTSKLTLDHVVYTHAGSSEPILNDITLHIPQGKFIGIIGSTGAGKSTLIDMILGLLNPTSGSVAIDNVDIQTNISGWQQQIGYVGQTITLLDDTIRKNIAFGITTNMIDEDAVWRALEDAQLAQFVRALPSGLETTVGERGTRLSGGERQRLGIARALYHDPSVLVLDEATSALDQENEALIMGTINGLKGKKTIIMVTHRPATLVNCDEIYSIFRGKIERADPAIVYKHAV